ncbi:MAG TPA: tRNA uridine-5-carboxymethylaminomethyl(34) synthesis enzyme MnmG, partial [Bacteroidales bacterium]|nr:tRNA uridine-5-carboxymethylaminomethyl(34) synthesis enzyme MnmG [Bacteroidales bacterium]
MQKYDVIVVGGGHAGCEAAAAVATMGGSVLLISMDMTKFAQMSCNPAVGGIAKGQIVREIDALGGYMGIVTDWSSIQFRMLNMSKGPAMWSPRSQCDRMIFSAKWREILEGLPCLRMWQDAVNSLLFDDNKVIGVKTRMGVEFYASSVVITAGTFLNGLMHIGASNASGGRSGDAASYGLTEQLISKGFVSGRMKTGTPPRLDGRTIDFSLTVEQPGDIGGGKFSFLSGIKNNLKQLSCYTVRTNFDVHESLKKGFSFSPLFNGTIKGVGP